MLYSTTQLSARTGSITGLRDLAAYLENHPGVPVPQARRDHQPARCRH
jgi:hypothetical protein